MATLAQSLTPESAVREAPIVRQRLMSVDALRGFDMFWILGADSLVAALHRMSQTGPTRVLATQLEHAEWAGFHFYDLIFPLFIFIAGVSLVFSLTKTIEQAGRAEALKRVFRRGILLFLIGIFYSGGFSHPWPDMRLMGVLNRIALAYLFAGLLFCFFKPRALVAICAGILLGYWALLTLVPIRDIQLTKTNIARLAREAGDLETATYFEDSSSTNASTIKNSPAWAGAQQLYYATTKTVKAEYGPGHNLADHTDFQYLPGKKYDVFYDPEGIWSTIPAVATCLLGVFAGLLLKSQSVEDKQKVLWLICFGVSAAAAGWLWNFQFPVVKKIWTSSFVLVAGGYSAVLLGAFFLIVDVWQRQSWCQPFVWIGMNSITIYVAKNLITGGFRTVAGRFVGGDIKAFFDNRVAAGLGDLILAFVGLALAFWLVHFLYRRKIFLRL